MNTIFPFLRMYQLALIFLLFAYSIPANAQVFNVDTIGCQLDDSAYMSRMVNHEAQFYNKVFNTNKNDTAAIRINLYGNIKMYTRTLKTNKLKATTNGVYSPELNKTFVYKNELAEHVILRAASNNLLLYNYPNAPKWLTEGIASVLSYMDETGDGKVAYIPLFDYNKLDKDLVWDKELDYDIFDYTFMDNNPDWSSKSKNPNLYALSYGIIYFLITRDKDYLTPMITSMKEGHTAPEAIASSFGDFDRFKTQFISYYRYAARSKFQ